MRIDISSENLPVYEALASPVRLQMLQLLCQRQMNVKELAAALSLSSSIITMHVRKLEAAGLIKTERIPAKSGMQKMSVLAVDHIDITFPKRVPSSFKVHKTEQPVGHYTDYQVEPTCGLATLEGFIGAPDDPRYFMDPRRMDARVLWFSSGFVEYKLPNFLQENQTPELLEFSFEISSEFPFTNDNWPSDISFTLNGRPLGYWTSPGDFGDRPGKLSPAWWPREVNQYGLLKKLLVTTHGTYIDGERISNVTIADVDVRRGLYTLTLAVKPDAEHVGGLTIFGKGFGDYDQNIELRVYYGGQ